MTNETNQKVKLTDKELKALELIKGKGSTDDSGFLDSLSTFLDNYPETHVSLQPHELQLLNWIVKHDLKIDEPTIQALAELEAIDPEKVLNTLSELNALSSNQSADYSKPLSMLQQFLFNWTACLKHHEQQQKIQSDLE